MSTSDITTRFLQTLDKLVNTGQVNSRRQFALSIGYHAQGISEMAAGRREVPLDLIQKAVQQFKINAQYLFTGKGPEFEGPDGSNFNLHELSIVTDEKGDERIVHVPVPAQAGYGSLHTDAVFMRDIPSYQLPHAQFKSGTYRSFEIAGASMEPTFRQHDIVIASYVEPRFWTQAVKDGSIYIIVTQEQVFIKRVVNLLKASHCIECISDNQDFQPFRIDAADLREVWRASMKLTTHFNVDNSQINAAHIAQQLHAQQKMLEHLQQQLSLVTHT
jgi:phage repressor protein C with HTH and peptisase S24 domain